MNHEVLMEKIVQSLTLEVEAVQNESDIQLTSTSKRTPVKIKIKVRKKHKADIYHDLVSVPKKKHTDHTTDQIQLTSSDQTVISFDMVMETDQALPMKKPRNKFLEFLKPGICLGNQNDEIDSYQSRKNQNTISSTTSASHGVLKKHLALSKNGYLNTTSTVSKKHQNFLGKCKPGGCLDPPFSEDKYSYIPIQKHSGLETPTITTKNLYIRDDICAHKRDSVIKTIIAKDRLSHPDTSIDAKVLSQELKRQNSILKLYQAESVNTSLSITYSNSIITYPPPLTSSEIRLNNEKNTQRMSSDSNRSKKSHNELPQAYFLPPKEIIHQFELKNFYRNNLLTKNDKNSFQNMAWVKSETDNDNINTKNMRPTFCGVITPPTIQARRYIKAATIDAKIEPIINDSIGINPETVDDCGPKDTKLFIESGGKSGSPLEVKHIILKELKDHESISITESVTIKSVDTSLEPYVRSSLTEINLNIHNSLPENLLQKENVTLNKPLDILPLSLEENSDIIYESITAHITVSKNDPKNVYTTVADNIGLNEKTQDGSIKDPKDYICKVDSNDLVTTKQLLRTGLETEVDYIFKESKEIRVDAVEKPHSLYNSDQSELDIITECVPESGYNDNDNLDKNVEGSIATTSENDLAPGIEDTQNNQDIKSSGTHMPSNNMEFMTLELTDTTMDADFNKKDGCTIETTLTKDILFYSGVLNEKDHNSTLTLKSDISMGKKLNTKHVDGYKSGYKNDENTTESLDKSKLAMEGLSYSQNNKPPAFEDRIGRKSLPSILSTLSRPSIVLITDHNAELEKHGTTKLDKCESEDFTRKVSQVIPDLKKAVEEVVEISSVETTEDPYRTLFPLLQQEKDLSQTDATISHGYFVKHDVSQNLENLPLGTEKSMSFSKEGILKEDILQYTRANKNVKLEKSETDIRSSKLIENKKNDFTVENLAEDSPQYLSHDIDNQYKESFKQEYNKYALMNQSPILLFESDLLKASQSVDSTEESIHANVDIKTAKISNKLAGFYSKDIGDLLGKLTETHIPFLDAAYSNVDISELTDIGNGLIEGISENNMDSVQPIDITLLEYDLKQTDEIKTTEFSHIKPLVVLNNVSVQDIAVLSTLSQKTANETTKYDLITVETSEIILPNFPKDKLQEKQFVSILPQLTKPIEEENFFNDGPKVNDQGKDLKNPKPTKLSTMFDVLASPDPKKLKEEIEALKYNSILTTLSENTLAKPAKESAFAVDLAFHSYINDMNEKIIKSFDSNMEPQRYSDDRVIIIKSDMNLTNNKIKIPIDEGNNLIIQVKRANVDHKQQDVSTGADKLSVDRKIVENNILSFKFACETNAKMANLNSVYEKELLPLQNAIKDLKEEIDYLAGHSKLRDNLLTRKSKPVRLTNVNKRCVCLKRML